MMEHISDDENTPPPPPPPSHGPAALSLLISSATAITRTSLATESSSKASSSYRRKNHRHLQVAKQFHTFVLQMKCFCSWKDHIALRKHVIRSKKNVLTRILYKWTVYVQEIQMKKKSTTLLIQLVDTARRKAIKFGLGRLQSHAKDVTLVEKIVETWRELSFIQGNERMKKLNYLTNFISMQRVSQLFNRWRSEIKVEQLSKKRKMILIGRILKGWNQEAKCQRCRMTLTLEQAILLIDSNKHGLMKKIFHVLVSKVSLQ